MKSFKLTLAFLMLSAFIVQAQDVKSIIDTNKRWSILTSYYSPNGGSHSTSHIEINGDTILKNTSYKIVNYPPTQFDRYFIRKDSVGKIYIKTPMSENEDILYDFTLTKGDTFMHFNAKEPTYKKEAFISGVDSLMINGQYHKRLEIDNGYEYWIEGIGSTLGLIYYYKTYDWKTALLCCHVNSQLIYTNDTNTSCDINVGIDDKKQYNERMTIYPTIVEKFVHIEKELKSDLLLTVYDIYGVKKIQCYINNEKQKINCSNLSNGMYIMVFSNRKNNTILKRSKIIKE